MKDKRETTTLRLAALVSSALLFWAATAQAQRPTLTSHVPEAVASNLAPKVGHVSAGKRLGLALSLPLRNQAELEDLLQQIYDPQSPNFHRYLSVQEFTDRFGPTASDHAAVLSFAQAHGLDLIDIPVNRMVIDVEGPVANIESAFHVSVGVYQHPTEARTFFAPDREPALDLDVPLLHIDGLDNFSIPQPKFIDSDSSETVATPSNGSGPGGSFTGSDLRMAYYGSGSLNGAGQSVGIFALKGYQMSDITNYFNNIGEPLNVPIKGVSVNGASLTCPPSSCNDGEQSLDIEQAISMAPGLKQLQFYVGSSNVSVFNQMAADNTSKTLSCSYGWAKNQSSLDPIFEEMASQGQSVFVATGDQGSGTAANVVWPSDDAWVTAVGGTDLSTKSAGGAWSSETAWNKSTGMPSPNKIPIPTWQQGAGIITSTNHGSTTYRNIPDVSSESNSNQYACYQGVCKNHGGGTSYAAPLWASLIALVNEQAANHGEANMGFINPALYSIGTGGSFTSDFHDIKSGSNGGYSAVTNYDLVTGWGSPQGMNLINALAP